MFEFLWSLGKMHLLQFYSLSISKMEIIDTVTNCNLHAIQGPLALAIFTRLLWIPNPVARGKTYFPKMWVDSQELTLSWSFQTLASCVLKCFLCSAWNNANCQFPQIQHLNLAFPEFYWHWVICGREFETYRRRPWLCVNSPTLSPCLFLFF